MTVKRESLHEDSNVISVKVFATHAHIQKDFEQVLSSRRRFHLTQSGQVAQVGVFDGEMSDVAATVTVITQQFSSMRAVLVALCNTEESLRWLCRGVAGIVSYDHYRRDLPIAVKYVAQGRIWCDAEVFELWRHCLCDWQIQVPDDFPAFRLTGREQEVLNMLVHSLSNKEIASCLNITERTAKFHVSNIFWKLDVSSRRNLREKVHAQPLKALAG